METQQLWESTTVQGGIIQILDLAALMFHLNIGNDLITQLVTGIFGIIGVGMVIYGRIKAVKPLALGTTILK